MTGQNLNGIMTLGIANLVVMLLAVSVRQQRRNREYAVPSLATALAVLAVHAAVQTLAIVIASNFFASRQVLIGFATAFALLPSAWCLLLVNDWLSFKRENAAPSEADPSEVLDMETARRYVVWGEYDNAKRAYLAYAEAHPKSPEPLFGLEGMYLSQGRYQDAANTCRQIMDRFGHDLQVWTQAAGRLADLLDTQLKRPHDADEVRSSIARRNPAYAPSAPATDAESPLDEPALQERLRRARELAQKGSTDSAVALLKHLRQSNPRDPRPLFELAIIFEATLQTEAARRSLDTLVRDFGGNPGIWAEASIKLADLYLNRYGNEEAARELLNRVIEKSPIPEDRDAARSRLDKLNHPWA